jgi:hypothetical protein
MGTPSIPTPATLWLFLLAAAFIYFQRKVQLTKPIKLVHDAAFA